MFYPSELAIWSDTKVKRKSQVKTEKMQPRYFHTHSPTPTTLLFTVSTRQPAHNSSSISHHHGNRTTATTTPTTSKSQSTSSQSSTSTPTSPPPRTSTPTRPRPPSKYLRPPRRLISYISGSLRILAALFILLIEFAQLGQEVFGADFVDALFMGGSSGTVAEIGNESGSGFSGLGGFVMVICTWASTIADAVDWRICTVLSLGSLWLLSRRTYTG